jgi:hypothetical protein
MTNEKGLSPNQLISELTKSPHGELREYLTVGSLAAKENPDLFAHLIAWNMRNGQIRDSKKALPVIALTNPTLHEDHRENALAHLAMLSPREFCLAYRFALDIRPKGYMSRLRKLVVEYLRDLESDRHGWNRAAVQHRNSLAQLYSLSHAERSPAIGSILFGGDGSKRRNREKIKGVLPRGSVFEAIATLKDMGPTEAAGVIITRKIPFLVAIGALGAKAKDPVLVQALLSSMSPTEVVTNVKAFERLGVKTVPALKAAFEEAIGRVANSKNKSNTFKTAQAIEAVDDEVIKEKLKGVQEKQIANMKGIEGNWLVLGDASGSMSACIEGARNVAATLAKMVRGKVTLTFFNYAPYSFDVSGMDYSDIARKTAHITAQGATSIGCGLLLAIGNKAEIDGIAIVSDAAENHQPLFADVYRAYKQSINKDIPVYLFRMGSKKPTASVPSGAYMRASQFDLAHSMQATGADLQEFDLNGTVDYYGLPNIIQTLRCNRYSLLQEIMDTPLKTVDQVLNRQKREVKHVVFA